MLIKGVRYIRCKILLQPTCCVPCPKTAILCGNISWLPIDDEPAEGIAGLFGVPAIVVEIGAEPCDPLELGFAIA